MDRRLFLLAALALGACATTPPTIVAPSAGGFAELEPLYRADAGREALAVSVATNGCTTKADFGVYLERKDNTLAVAIGRKRVDTCNALVQGRTEIRFSWVELGVPADAQVFILNPLVPWTGPGS